MGNDSEHKAQLDAVIEFNELYGEYTRDLREFLVELGLSRPDITVLRKMGSAREGTTSAWLRLTLDMDAGHLSRSLRMLEAHRFVTLRREQPDTRYLQVRLTADGLWLLDLIDQRMRDVASRMMRHFPAEDRVAIVSAMRALSGILRHRRLWPCENNVLVPFQVPRLRRAD